MSDVLYTVPWLPQLERHKNPARRQVPGVVMTVTQCLFWTSFETADLDEVVSLVGERTGAPHVLIEAAVQFAVMLGMFALVRETGGGDA